MQCDNVDNGPIGGDPVYPLAPKPCRKQAKFTWRSKGHMRHTCSRHTPERVRLQRRVRLSR